MNYKITLNCQLEIELLIGAHVACALQNYDSAVLCSKYREPYIVLWCFE